MSSLGFEALSVSYGKRRALDPVTDHVMSGEWLGLIGPNGAGKSSLLRAIAGLVAFGGDVSVDGTSLAGLHDRERASRVAYVAQNPLIPDDMTTFEYVLLGRTPYISYFATDTAHDRQVTREVIERLELEEFSGRALGSMSGGERQRVVLARALAQEAPVLLLDEPTSALDIGHQQQALELVTDLREHHGLTVVSAMHDLTLAGTYTDRLLLLDEGSVVARGTAAEVLTADRIGVVFDVCVSVEIDPADGTVIVTPRRALPGRT